MQDSLTRNDWERILETIYQTSAATDVDAFAKAAFAQLYILTPFDKAMLLPLAYPTGEKVSYPCRTYTYGMESKYGSYAGAYDNDPFFMAMTRNMHPEGFLESAAYAEDRKIEEQLYQDFYEPQGIHHALRITLHAKEVPMAQFILFRKKGAPDFDESAGVICTILSKHLSQKYEQLLVEQPVVTETGSKLRGAYNLSQRECQIAEMIAAGKSDQEIAEELVISLSTVKKHVYNAYAKLGVNKRVQLIMAVSEMQ